jgi:hypothetical protein
MVSLIRLKVTYIYLLRKNSIHLEKVTKPFLAFSNSGIRSTDPAKDAGNFCMSVLKAWKNTDIKIKHF